MHEGRTTHFRQKCSRRDQNLVPATRPKNSNWFEFVGQVPGNLSNKLYLVPSCELFVGQVPVAKLKYLIRSFYFFASWPGPSCLKSG